MVENNENTDLSAIFAALSHPTRRAILKRLAQGDDLTITQLSAPFEMSFAAISKHTRVLERAGLIERKHVGRESLCRLVGQEQLHLAGLWLVSLEEFWRGGLDRLYTYLTHPKTDQ